MAGDIASRHSGLPPCSGTHCQEQPDLEQRAPLCCTGAGGAHGDAVRGEHFAAN